MITAPKHVNEVERPVWFVVLPGGPMGTDMEGQGPFTIQDMRLKWADAAISGETL